jgi:hypothetical protein
MAGLSHLRDVYEKRGKDFLENILNKSVIINEKSDGAFFGAKRDEKENKFNLFKKDSKIGYIDRVLSGYYEQGIRHFENIEPTVISQVPENYVFGMDYRPGRSNPITLTHIKVLDENFQAVKMIHERDELNKWAELLQVNPPNILFQGKLTDDQKVKIQEFVFTPLQNLVERFKTQSFTKHIMSVLNPTLTEEINSPDDREIEEIVFRFTDDPGMEDNLILAKLVDPVFYDAAKHVSINGPIKRSDDYIWIIVIDLMNFIESYRNSQLRSFTVTGENQEERFISLLNHLFVEFIHDYGDKYNDLEIQVPEFLKQPEFDVNQDLITDPMVIDLIRANSNYKEIYRIFINVFRKKKVKVNSQLFTDSMKVNLVNQIQRLYAAVADDRVFENYFPSFNEFVGDDREPGYFETYDVGADEARKVKKVNLLLSEFQPIHNGHIKNAKRLSEKTGLPTLLVCIHPGKTSKMYPFKTETMNNVLNKITASDSQSIAGHVMIDDGNIETILKAIKPNFEPSTIAAEPSRIRDLALQLELARKRSRNLNIKRGTKLIEVPTSSTGDTILSSIQKKDFGTYKQFTPVQMHSEFYNLNKDLTESLGEGIINESIILDKPEPERPKPNIQVEP